MNKEYKIKLKHRIRVTEILILQKKQQYFKNLLHNINKMKKAIHLKNQKSRPKKVLIKYWEIKSHTFLKKYRLIAYPNSKINKQQLLIIKIFRIRL